MWYFGVIDDIAWVTSEFPDLVGLTRLGQGGQKVVYEANHPTEGAVCLKLIRPNQDPERVAREVLAMTQIRCPRVPTVFDHGTVASPSGNVIWLREQRIAGASLRGYLNKGPISLVEGLRLARDLLGALVVASSVRIVHRDVKPENVMVDAFGDFWLLDFGFARHLGLTSLTATAALGGVGTLGYAPPEQYQNRKADIDARADLFAVGVTVYEAIHGVHPYRHNAQDAREVLRRIETLPLPVRRHPDDRDGKVMDLLRTLAQRRREHRPSTAAEALQWVRDLLAIHGVI